MIDYFDINVKVFSTGQPYRMKGLLIYQDNQCIRFRIEMIYGKFEKVSLSDGYDLVRTIGAACDRWITRQS